MTTIVNLNKHAINIVIDGEMAEIAPKIEQSSDAYAIIPPDQESRCIMCGEEANGAPACWGCWDDALYAGLI